MHIRSEPMRSDSTCPNTPRRRERIDARLASEVTVPPVLPGTTVTVP